jgi:mannose-6-phosphate isomerase-like protein (cupin superfamily)
MAVVLEGGCRVSEMREGEPLIEGTLCLWNRVGRATGARAISLRVMEFAPGLSPGIRNDDCDEILYVLPWERESSVRDEVSTSRRRGPQRGSPAGVADSGWVNLLINGQSHEVGPDTGIYIRPGEIFAIDNRGPASVILVSSQCPDPDCAPRFVRETTASSVGPSSAAHPPLVCLAGRPAQPTADRWYRVLVDDEIGSTQVTQFVGSIPPGRAPDHFHNYEEVLFILKGKGRMWAGETNTPIAPGACIYLPKGQVHCVENTGKDELRLLGVFYPAGSPSVRYDV